MAIPKNMQGKHDKIAPMIVKFCNEKLNGDYSSNSPFTHQDYHLEL